ncbi:hypothetical protein HHX47_DHR2000179, partial [Lentinula edodes]
MTRGIEFPLNAPHGHLPPHCDTHTRVYQLPNILCFSSLCYPPFLVSIRISSVSSSSIRWILLRSSVPVAHTLFYLCSIRNACIRRTFVFILALFDNLL